MFKKIKKETFPEREVRILEFWKNKKIFEKSLENRKENPLYSFYDGPPFATGLPHYGHLLASTIKDVIPRYKTMKGYYVPRRFGWDCHGLPVENEIEKSKELSGTKEIENFGIANFNEECKNIVLRYTKEWQKIIERFGRWVDFSNTYKTMDISFMETVWWIFKQLWDKNLIYEGFKVMPFSTKLGTPLSNFEANLNYQEVNDPSITVSFEMQNEPNTYFLAWTTTPWTLISNLALTIGKDLDYVKIKDLKTDKKYILAKSRYKIYFSDNYKIEQTFKGEDLIGIKYKPLFPYFADKSQQGAFRVISDEFVSTEEGTGIVHTAPAFGEVDFFCCKKEKIDLVCPVDNNGKFTKEVPDFEGILVKDADKEILKRLKNEGLIFKKETIKHRYPFCWRSDTPLIYKAVNTWFVAVEKIKKDLIDINKQIYWVPKHIKYGRFGKWLENARDWAISRNRYWGTPIPIWKSKSGKVIVISSIKDLEEKSKEKISDLHRHHIDSVTFKHENEVYKRIPEVFDCWFESGSMPYGQNHYPFENKEKTEKGFPADFIAEGLDQTRGWFYTLNVLSCALFDKPAFKNVIVNGIILAEDGTKMSKRLKNYPEPSFMIDKFGSDAIRLYMINSPAVKGEDLCFSKDGVKLVLRQVLIPFWNSFYFLSTYANIYNWTFENFSPPKEDIDKWILSVLQTLIENVENALEKYDLPLAIQPIIKFIDQLTNWYIRRSRERFWEGKNKEAFETLYRVLLIFSKISAPFIPFITEAVYQEIKTKDMKESVHLCNFPEIDKKLQNKNLEIKMNFVQQIVSMGHSLRKKEKIKVRQPLKIAYIVTKENLKNFENLIKEELNVKKVSFVEDESNFVKLLIKPNFRILGKKAGKLMPKFQKEILSLDQEKIKSLEENKKIEIEIDDKKIEISKEDVLITRQAKENIIATGNNDIVIAIDITLNEELKEEGIAREIVNKINTMRRENDFEVTDRITVKMDTTDVVKKSYKKYKEYICKEILATKFCFEKNLGTAWDISGQVAIIEIKKA